MNVDTAGEPVKIHDYLDEIDAVSWQEGRGCFLWSAR